MAVVTQGAEPSHHFQHVAATHRIERRGRLVEDQQLRPANLGLGNSEALTLATRKTLDRSISLVAQPHQCEGVADVLLEFAAGSGEKELRRKPKCFPGGHVVVVPGVLRQVTDPPPHFEGVAFAVKTE